MYKRVVKVEYPARKTDWIFKVGSKYYLRLQPVPYHHDKDNFHKQIKFLKTQLPKK